MKKIIGVILICLLLCACQETPSPEMQFDTALTNVEQLEKMKTVFILTDMNGEELTYIETKSENIQTKPAVEMVIDQEKREINEDDPLAMLCRFSLLGNDFFNFSREENPEGDILSFEVGMEDHQALAQALNEWILTPFQEISGIMYLDEQEQLEKIVYQIQTEQGTYHFELLLEDEQ